MAFSGCALCIFTEFVDPSRENVRLWLCPVCVKNNGRFNDVELAWSLDHDTSMLHSWDEVLFLEHWLWIIPNMSSVLVSTSFRFYPKCIITAGTKYFFLVHTHKKFKHELLPQQQQDPQKDILGILKSPSASWGLLMHGQIEVRYVSSNVLHLYTIDQAVEVPADFKYFLGVFFNP